MRKLLSKYLGLFKWQVFCVLFFVACQVASSLALPSVMAKIVDVGLPANDIDYIISKGGIMLLMSLGQVVAMLGVGYFSSRISSGVGRAMRHDIFVNAESFSLNEMDSLGVSSMIKRNTADVTTLQNFAVMLMRMMLTAPITLIGSIVLTFSINKELAKVLLVSVPLLLALFIIVVAVSTKLFAVLKQKDDRLNLLLREHLSGTRVIRAFVNQQVERDKFETGNEELYKIALKVTKIVSSLMPFLFLIINMTTVAVCYFGAIQIEAGGMQVGQLMSFVQYVTQILMSIAMLSMLMVILPRANVSAKRVNEVLNLQTVISSPKVPKLPDEGNVKNDVPKGTVEFKNVTFTYPGGDAPVINDVSFIAKGGKTTAIIGSTGSGKSTLLSLIPRLYDTPCGQVLLDGQNVVDYEIGVLRERIGYVPQKGYLFSGTIADNVRFGFPNASDAQVEEALKVSQAWDFVSSRENGVDDEVSQGGKNVSGGQKQRLAIARAIVRDCEVYIFDDSFSALDFETDSRLRAALANNPRLQKATKIIVAQRVSTIMNADEIIVLDKGFIVGRGKHAQLLKDCPLYYEIASSQLSIEELEKEQKKTQEEVAHE